jgi:phosphoserine phosphatase RsbU/P
MSDINEDLIRQVALFSELPEDEIRHLAQTLRLLQMPPQTIVFREGEPGQRLYLIRSGQIEVIKSLGLPDEWLLSVRGPGEYIGEMSLLNVDGLRTATVRTASDAEMLEMTRDDFDALLNRRPSLAYDMVRVLSDRLSQANNAAIRDLSQRNQRLEKAYAELKAAQTQLIIKEKLEHELLVARQVQASLLPQHVPQSIGWTFAAHWEPAREVAGDFYDFIMGADGRLGIVIADVADKGMPSALFMALSRSILRASLTQAQPLIESFVQANRLICADSSDSMFVTLCYVSLNTATGDGTYLNAGHNPALFYRAETDQLDWLSHTGMPMGIDAEAVFTQRTFSLAPGDFLVLYTDGVTDALDLTGSEFDAQRLWQLVYDLRHTTAMDIMEALKRALADFVGDSQPVDDITIVAVKRDSELAS